MLRALEYLFCIFVFLTGVFAADQDILTILKQHSDLSTFTAYLEQYPDLINTLNNGTFTVLAPNNDALSAFAQQNPDQYKDPSQMLPLFQYHIVHDTHPSATFGLAPLFPPTLLTNTSYTNVTGGQVVELTTINDQPTIISGIKANSSITTRDVFFLGGLVQAISTVLTIPISFPATITAAELNDLVALLNKGGWLTPSSPVVGIVNSLPDLTIFGPNDPRYGAAYTGWDGLSDADKTSILDYSIVQGKVFYSSDFQNQTKSKTLGGESLTISEYGNDFFVDAAKITTRDYLCSNGVLQVIDQPLDPNNTNARPAIAPTEAPSSGGGGGISGAAGAGIGIAIGAVLFGTLIVACLVLRKRRKAGKRGMFRLHSPHSGPSRRTRGGDGGGVELQGDERGAPPRYELDNKSQPGNVVNEISPVTPATGTDSQATVRGTQVIQGDWYGHDRSASGTARGFILRGYSPTEADGNGNAKPPSPLEIDGTERSRISITVHGEQPRHLGFQARY